jgi:dTDP-4-dehydrorhamnose 3,5-epimerase
MKIAKMKIDGPLLAISKVHRDNRGSFLEWFKLEELNSMLDESISFTQGNVSISSEGVLRGIHYSIAEIGQSKWVTCLSGKIEDFIIDLRLNSPTFKQYLQITLSGLDGQAIFIPQGFGHAFVSMEENSIVSYLVSSDFDPNFEQAINPMDQDINVRWPTKNLILSEKDKNAYSLLEMVEMKLLPMPTSKE